MTRKPEFVTFTGLDGRADLAVAAAATTAPIPDPEPATPRTQDEQMLLPMDMPPVAPAIPESILQLTGEPKDGETYLAYYRAISVSDDEIEHPGAWVTLFRRNGGWDEPNELETDLDSDFEYETDPSLLYGPLPGVKL